MKLKYLLEFGCKKCMYEMTSLELKTFDDVEEWIISSINSDCEYFDIILIYSIKKLFENKKKRIIEIVVDVGYYDCSFINTILESNFDIVSKIISCVVIE